MELLMGVVENLRIQSVISSLFDLIFPEQDEGSFSKRINDKLNQLFDEAIGSVEVKSPKLLHSGGTVDGAFGGDAKDEKNKTAGKKYHFFTSCLYMPFSGSIIPGYSRGNE